MSLWHRLRGRGAQEAASARRWVVVDVETSGLDLRRDRLLAIAAVALQVDGEAPPRIALGDSFEALLRQDSAAPVDKDNILLHGIGVGAQRGGVPAIDALGAFERWLAQAPLIAFHAAFDETMIRRAMKATLGRTLASVWLDLEPVADVLHPQVGGATLDDWLAHFDIECAGRHQAAADAMATAELLLRLGPAARTLRCASFAGLRQLAADRQWLGRR